MNTADLISQLSQDSPKARLRSPGYFGCWLGAVLVAYGLGAQFFLHIRPDLIIQLTRPMFALEIILLGLLIITNAASAILAMYPDMHQKHWALNLPYIIFAALIAFILFQLMMPHDTRMVMPKIGSHGMECALCIASVALIPSALIFTLVRKGASVHPLRAGSFAVLAASGIGCLTQRLSEANDSLMHLTQWHYLPTLLFAALGALIGKWLLKW